MNRPLFIAAFAFLALSIPLSAQRGGGGGHASGGGGHGGFSSHSSFGGGFGGARSFSGSRSSGGFGAHSYSPRSYSRGSFNRGSINRSSAFNRGRFGNRSGVGVRIRSYGHPYYGRNCWGGYGCGYGWGYPYLGGGVDPYWWWGNDSDSGGDPGPQYGDYDNGLANQMQQQGVPMRPAPDPSGDQDYYARSTPPQHQDDSTKAGPATVLVFRDQHQEEVQNYAIVGQTLWNFTGQRTQKIPLSDLDVPATQKANDDRGVDFHLPSGNEGQ